MADPISLNEKYVAEASASKRSALDKNSMEFYLPVLKNFLEY